jgi:hypothetical protein
MLCESALCFQLGRGKTQREALMNTVMGPWVLEKPGNFSACQEWLYNIELVTSKCITIVLIYLFIRIFI